MINNEFYVDVISNASLEYYPNNTLSKFTNILKTPLELKGQWEVGMIEFFHPNRVTEEQQSNSSFLYARNDEKMRAPFIFSFRPNSDVRENTKIINKIMLEDASRPLPYFFTYKDQFSPMSLNEPNQTFGDFVPKSLTKKVETKDIDGKTWIKYGDLMIRLPEFRVDATGRVWLVKFMDPV